MPRTTRHNFGQNFDVEGADLQQGIRNLEEDNRMLLQIRHDLVNVRQNLAQNVDLSQKQSEQMGHQALVEDELMDVTITDENCCECINNLLI